MSACPAARDVTAAQYAEAVLRAAALIGGLDNAALAAAVQQVTELAERRRYESAARLRDHLATAIEALWHGQRLRALAALPELIAAKPDGPREGGYQLAVIRHGQLAAAGRAPRGVPPMPVVDAIRRGAQAILPTPAPLGGALVEEIALIARWLAEPGVRIVGVSNDAAGLASQCARPARGQRGRQRRARPSWPASSSAEVGSQICRPNRTHRASNCSAAPVSIAALARRNPSSQAGSHSARLDNPAWATIAPAALSTTASRTGPWHRPTPRAPRPRWLAHRLQPAGQAGRAQTRIRRDQTSTYPRCPPQRARSCSWWWWSTRPAHRRRVPPAHWTGAQQTPRPSLRRGRRTRIRSVQPGAGPDWSAARED